jgi:hypothetical protein
MGSLGVGRRRPDGQGKWKIGLASVRYAEDMRGFLYIHHFLEEPSANRSRHYSPTRRPCTLKPNRHRGHGHVHRGWSIDLRDHHQFWHVLSGGARILIQPQLHLSGARKLLQKMNPYHKRLGLKGTGVGGRLTVCLLPCTISCMRRKLTLERM